MKKKFNILIIEDDQDLLAAMQRSLIKEGYSVTTANTLNDGESLIKKYYPSLFILDVVLPDGNGMEFAKKILNDPQYSGSSIILVSGNRTSREDFNTAFRSGVIDYLAKPFRLTELNRKIQIIYRLYQLIDKQKRTEKKYFKLFNNSNDLIFTMNTNGDIVLSNSVFKHKLDILSINASQNINRFIENNDKPVWDKAIKSIVEGKILGSFNISLKSNSKKLLPVNIFLSGIHDESDDNLRILGIASDLSDQKLLQLEFHENDAEVRERELKSWSDLSNTNTGHTAAIYQGESPFEKDSKVFKDFCFRYQRVLDKLIERRIYKIDYNQETELNSLANDLGFLKASPKEIIKINSTVIKNNIHKVHPKKLMIYHEETRIVMLELMGYLTNYYRNRV